MGETEDFPALTEPQQRSKPAKRPTSAVTEFIDFLRRLWQSAEYTASADQVDSLVLDSSILSPAQAEKLKLLVSQADRSLKTIFGRFIPAKKITKQSGVEDRTIYTSKKLIHLLSAWNRDCVGKEAEATTTSAGMLTFLFYPLEGWSDLPEAEQKRLIAYYGTQDQAVNAVQQSRLITVISHEIAHQYGDPRLPSPFKECGARYYAREVTISLEKGYLSNALEEKRTDFYAMLVDKFGEDVHRLFFGGNVNVFKRMAITAQFSPEVTEELFPEDSD